MAWVISGRVFAMRASTHTRASATVGDLRADYVTAGGVTIYLHYVLDQWFEREVKPRLRGEAHLVRYADDWVMAFELRDDAERGMEVLGKRMGRFGLTLHPDKTRLLPGRISGCRGREQDPAPKDEGSRGARHPLRPELHLQRLGEGCRERLCRVIREAVLVDAWRRSEQE